MYLSISFRLFHYVLFFFFFFFNDTATTEIYTLSLHDALPICDCPFSVDIVNLFKSGILYRVKQCHLAFYIRSEEHTSELQSRRDLVCRLLLEKKKKIQIHQLTENIYFSITITYTYTSNTAALL